LVCAVCGIERGRFKRHGILEAGEKGSPNNAQGHYGRSR
jgi:hypothetical protein